MGSKIKSHAVIDCEAREPVLPRFPEYGLCILESRHVPGFRMPPTRYDFWEVMLVIGGAGWVEHGSTREPLQPSDLIVVPAGCSYSVVDGEQAPLSILCLCIRPSPSHRSLFNSLLPKEFFVHRSMPLSSEAALHLRTILLEQSRPHECSEAVVIAHALILLSRLARRQGGQEAAAKRIAPREIELLARVRDYVEQLESGFHESETIEGVAARLGMSPKSLTTYFRQVTGVSRHRYIQNLRLEYACRLLENADQSITSIAFACGFEDLSTFFRAFRLAKKVSPSQWREQAS